MKPLELKGNKFGHVEILERVENDRYGKTRWLCKCDCGKEWVVSSANIKKIKQCKTCGYKINRTVKHNGCGTRLYEIYSGMINRCNNPNNKSYQHYGGRHIRVCDEWKTFENFREWAVTNGYNDTLSIERIDVNGDYCPSNCKWIPMSKQVHNRRNSLRFEIDGEIKDLAEWTKEYEVNYFTAYSRLRRGADISKALGI